MRNLISDMKAWEANSDLFFLPTIWWLDALKRREEITLENTFEQKKKKPGLKFNCGLSLSGLRTTGPWIEGNDAIDLKLESSDSQDNSKDYAQSHCSEMVAFVSLPLCVILSRNFYPAWFWDNARDAGVKKNVIVRHKERTCRCKSRRGGAGHYS